MKDRLENLRRFLPAEMTAAYVAIQGVLAGNDVGPTEHMWLMFWLAIALAAVNALIYWRVYELNSI